MGAGPRDDETAAASADPLAQTPLGEVGAVVSRDERAAASADPRAQTPLGEVEAVVSRPALRDAREDARAQLTQAYTEDLLDADELDSRLERLENATDLPVVAALVADLERVMPAAMVSSVPAVIDVPAAGRTIAVFSGTRRAGMWKPARVNQVLSVFGGADIDLRDVVLPPGEIEIRVLCLFGGIDITVPPGTHVQLDCTAIFGGTDQEDASVRPEPGATVVRVTGLVMFGAVDVHERLPGESGWAARKRRKAARRELHAQRSAKALPPKR